MPPPRRGGATVLFAFWGTRATFKTVSKIIRYANNFFIIETRSARSDEVSPRALRLGGKQFPFMRAQSILTAIQECALLKNLDEINSHLMLHYGKIRLIPAGETIFKKGDFSRGIFSLILSGRIGIISETGQVIRGMGIGEILGEIGVTSPQNKRSATAKAVQATELFEWNIEIIQQHLPEVMKRLKDLAWKNASNYY